jgi:hypothetical protein
LLSGLLVDVLNLRVEDVNIYDIATSLAHTCFAGGHVKKLYTNAQHSIYVSHYAGQDLYVDKGVEELFEDKLSQLLELKYHSTFDAIRELGSAEKIRSTFFDFHLFLQVKKPGTLFYFQHHVPRLFAMYPRLNLEYANPAFQKLQFLFLGHQFPKHRPLCEYIMPN